MKYPDFMDYYLAIAIGLDNHEVVDVYGFGGEFLNEDRPLKIKTSRKEDVINDISEDGIHVEIFGLDVNFNRISETVKFEESRVVHTKSNFYRVNSACVTNGINIGDISIDKFLVIPSMIGNAMNSNYTLPNNMEGYITTLYNPNDEDMSLIIRNGQSIKKVLSFRGFYEFKVPYKVKPATDIVLRSDNLLDGSMQIILLENS